LEPLARVDRVRGHVRGVKVGKMTLAHDDGEVDQGILES
jgi:DNA-binding FrmR family transcriptional regulator